MRARLERDVERRAAGTVPGSRERVHFRVSLALALVPAFADDLAAAHENRADDRVRLSCSAPALGELESSLEEAHPISSTSPR